MASTSKSLANTYQKKTDKEHVLDNPDTYTGSMEETEYDTYIFNNESNKIESGEIKIIPRLYKLFDEGIVNCRDHQVRMKQAAELKKPNIIPVSYINITIQDDIISMTNDGNGIDVEKHPEYDIWIPELIFGHLRTSTNYNKDEKRIVGGKNGFGFKLVLIWSSWGKIETIDHIRGLKYEQEFSDNLNVINKPKITKCTTKKPYTKVTFKPDYKRLNLNGLSGDMISLLKRRVYDIAAVTDKNVKVNYNGELVPVKNFTQYVDMYIGNKTDTNRVYEENSDRWEYAVCLAPKEEFTQVSFVNGIYTGKGGKHVEYILNQIIRKLTDYIKKKKKIEVKSNTIKEQIMLFVRCDIDNPTFDSQTKDYMNTPVSNFGSKCEVSDKFIEKIAKLGIMDAACALTEVKENKVAKKLDGSKSKNIRGIPKLVDANLAGTSKSNQCTLILCEGDSAKAGIISGLSKEDRDIIGVYPLRGKLLNVRGEPNKKILENKEISEFKQILGLEIGKKYDENIVKEKLRYGKILFMTDQDLDGSHIKGLGINAFDCMWNSLVNIPGFIGFMNTPILKARKGNNEILFYNDGEYEEWKENNDITSWKIKYYKGLGTSTSKEFKEYFENKKIVNFNSNGSVSEDAIDMVFNKTRANDRKLWLEKYNRELYLDTRKELVTYDEFINYEMIHFSKYDCDRSIPNIMDGLKTSLRKILYTAFKRKLTQEIKVAQFSGSVSEISCYHHGESSLNGAIVGMAQNFVGSNNINLLEPKGQFGTRLQGGNDSASERYIYTQLNPITRHLFPESDDCILKYLDDDGTSVEPIYYAPIIPMILVNGCKGIGTGFSTDILSYNPCSIIEYITAKLNNTDTPNIKPYYHGFTGTINEISTTKFLIKGCYEVIAPNKVHVTELPVGLWTDDFKQHIENIIDGDIDKKTGKKIKSETIIDYTDMSTDKNIDFIITFTGNSIENLQKQNTEHGCNMLEKLLKLYTTRTTTNMHMFDEEEKLRKFDNIYDILDHFINVRLNLYTDRKKKLLDILEQQLIVLSNKARFISENLDDTIDLRRKKKDVVIDILTKAKYDIVDDDKNYKYLLNLPIDSVTDENYLKLIYDRDTKSKEYEILKYKSEKDIWINELHILAKEYNKYTVERNKENNVEKQTIKLKRKNKR